jgi:enoyl-CoA hydratase
LIGTGGLELALLCDLRIAESDAVLGVFCRRFGVPLIDGGTVRLPKIVGLGRALDLILTGVHAFVFSLLSRHLPRDSLFRFGHAGRPVLAHEAHSMGLVNRIVDKHCVRSTSAFQAQFSISPRRRKLGLRTPLLGT